MLQDEQLKIISDCSSRLVTLSLRNEKEEKERREAMSNEAQREKEKREALTSTTQERRASADKKVINYQTCL